MPDPSPPLRPVRARWLILACCIVTMMTAVAAHQQLQRLIDGRLYLFSLPWDAAATDVQIEDARQSASDNQWNAVLMILVLGVVFSATARSVCQPKHWQWNRTILLAFILSVLADLATTIWFFQRLGVEFEFHPAIRPFAFSATLTDRQSDRFLAKPFKRSEFFTWRSC